MSHDTLKAANQFIKFNSRDRGSKGSHVRLDKQEPRKFTYFQGAAESEKREELIENAKND